MINENIYILGGGITGLVAGYKTGHKIFEANSHPGGICSSYYIRSGENKRLFVSGDSNAYRFETGGGHWIFGLDDNLTSFIHKFASLKKYKRISSVYFHNVDSYIPYPIQNHLRYLDRSVADQALCEISGHSDKTFKTMEECQEQIFGPTLCKLFFFPFHELYTAGLYDKISPQDSFKSPIDLSLVIKGASERTSPAGYNVSFGYPTMGLSELAYKISETCDIEYNKCVTKIDIDKKEFTLNNSETIPYNKLISTLPLNRMMKMTGLLENTKPDPYTSVLVLNIGAVRGDKCPDDHWLYIPDSKSGFHRVGFYSNVDKSFLPEHDKDKISLYVERAFPGGLKPREEVLQKYIRNVIEELQQWRFIDNVDVVDSTWIDVAYTWAWPDSNWKESSINILKEHDIYQIGRYGKWSFQGIADSIRDGLSAPDIPSQ